MEIVSASLVPVDESSAARAIGRFLSQAGASSLPPDAAASLATLQATLEGRGKSKSSKKHRSKVAAVADVVAGVAGVSGGAAR